MVRSHRNISSRQSMSLRLPRAWLCGTWAEETVDHRGSPRCLQRNAGCKLLQEVHSLSDAFLPYDGGSRLKSREDAPREILLHVPISFVLGLNRELNIAKAEYVTEQKIL